MEYAPKVCGWLAAAVVSCMPTFAWASPSPGAVVSVDPPVPTAAGQPCVVRLFEGLIPTDAGGEGYTYTPPPACPPPWSKVILKADFFGTRYEQVQIGIDLDAVMLFGGATPGSTSETSWHVERDVTDYTALFKDFHWGAFFVQDEAELGSHDSMVKATAWVEFYPATAATPAPRVPDAVFSTANLPAELPHNIERAYLDVYAAARWWYTSVPRESFSQYPALGSPLAPGDLTDEWAINPPPEGYPGTAYAEVRAYVDNQAAGLAPVFPVLPSSYNWALPYMLEDPAPSLQRLNIAPWRMNLTPFAAVLNEAGQHTIQLSGPAWGGGLLVYLDKGRKRVGGAVTENSLPSQLVGPTINNGLAPDGDAVKGSVDTQANRDFVISGVVNTSHGRIQTRIHQTHAFQNTQTLDVQGLGFAAWRSYAQDVDLRSTVDQETTVSRGNHVLSHDLVHASYPLNLHYRLDTYVDSYDEGWDIYITGVQLGASQARTQTRDYDGQGSAHYSSRLADSFDAVRERDANGADTSWLSATSRDFRDDAGSCRTAALGMQYGAVDTQTQGIGCPDGQNQVRWFAHPDGSPDGLGWME